MTQKRIVYKTRRINPNYLQKLKLSDGKVVEVSGYVRKGNKVKMIYDKSIRS